MAKDTKKTEHLIQALHGWHFASDGVRPAMYIEAASYEDAAAIYLKQSTVPPAPGHTSSEEAVQ